jgi:hypothetical protein
MKTIDSFSEFEASSRDNIGKSRPTCKVSHNQREVKSLQVYYL